MMGHLSIVFAVLTAACLTLSACGGGAALKSAGEACVASSECDDGLTCDFAANPPVCASQQGQPPVQPDAAAGDAAPGVDAAPVRDAMPPVDTAPPIDTAPPVDALAADA